mgnify:CR=1 FL=1|jgi:predicted nucleic acid-binding Zn ribbon protein|tara:strand:+ start:246 stop:488 length:243 start_codon:yes stop_codon:yes gene_type:complete
MPTYNFRDKETGEVSEEIMKMADREPYLKTNPNLEQILEMPRIVSGVAGARKSDDNFKDVLRNIKHHHKKATFDPDGDPS